MNYAMQAVTSFNHALSDATRWRIALLVAEQPLCVCELEDGLRLPQSTLSSHLTVLREAGLLEVEKRGKWAFYRMAEGMRALFAAQRAHFAAELESDLTFRADRERTAQRVALRGSTDCGGDRRRPIPPRLDSTATAGCCAPAAVE